MQSTTQTRNPITGMRLSDYDPIFEKESERLLENLRKKDLGRKRPVDRTQTIICFAEICICKLYGIQKFYKTESDPQAVKLLIYMYHKVTGLDQPTAAKKLDINKMKVWRSIEFINNEKDDLQLKRIKYLIEKLQDFYNKI